MKFWNVRGIAAILFLICSTSSLAQPAANAPADSQATVTIADAQKAYVAGKWKDAARLFEQACPNEPDSVRTECYLWNVLALSQIGAAKEFSTAGKRLDSLIKKTNPQKAVYADLMMTKAQFQLYMGRNEKAAEALIHAIETSQPHQAIVLQKVCAVVQSKVKNPTLDETCKRLSEPGVDASTPTPDPTPSTGSATEQPAAVQSVTEQPATEPKAAAQPANDATTAPAAEPAKTAPADTAAKATPAPAVQPEKPVPAPAPEKEYWILQLGAFGVKSNAELLVNNLKKQGIKGTIEERVGETKTLYLVQTGKFETKEKAVDFGASKLTPLNVEFRPILKK
ncbi:Sporulation related domain-containing protein [Fibrobacter sp. UWR3]|nr:Sporulation related domain-containing protein [Fibrobacter sp. UWR3]